MSQNENDIIIKELNDTLDEIIEESKLFEAQIKSLEKIEYLEEYWYSNDYGNKKLKSKQFKIKLAHMLNEIDETLFEQIFAHTLEKLANKLIYTTNKEKNQIIAEIITKIKKNVKNMMMKYINL